ALAAVGALCRESGISSPSRSHIRARFAIAGGDHTFTGDSIGLAAALVVYTQLLQPELLRHERFIACGAAFTGGVDAAGRLQPVNENTLRAKVERAFFSAVKYLVLPRVNLENADKQVAELNRTYPRRKLLLVGAETLNDIIEDRNIVRAERVCIGQFVARKTLKYSRAVRIQVPILLALLYFLVCLLFPKAWIGFDRNPELVWLNENSDQVLVFNRDSTLLWSCPVDCPPAYRLHAITSDLDNNGRNEVIYTQWAYESVACPESDLLTVRDAGGKIMFTRKCSILGEYPGDTVPDQQYLAKTLNVLTTSEGPVIITNMVQSFPGRSHIKIWSAEGQLFGWYVHAGHALRFSVKDTDGDGVSELLGFGINNPAVATGLFVLPLKGCFGASPPYEDPVYDLSGVTRGNQLHYLLFPTSDLNVAVNIPYDWAGQIAILPGNSIRMDVQTFTEPSVWRSYYIDERFRVWKVALSDYYWNYRQPFVEDGRLPAMDLDSFCQRELSRVKYWTPDGWITQAELRASLE
ncbi:MAG: hypothetical protein JSU65_04395, partial [Candidatus Zixiibacteriota bacterium]